MWRRFGGCWRSRFCQRDWKKGTGDRGQAWEQGVARLVDWLDLQRLATALVMPLGLLLGLAGLALVWRVRWLGVLVAGLGLGLIGACSLPVVSTVLLSGLEGDYPPRAAAACEPADAIVVLGGAVQPLSIGDVRPRLHRGSGSGLGGRAVVSRRLYAAGGGGIHCWLPSAGALEASELALKEALGYWVQVRLRA